jgi:hypothetical protein
MLKPEQAGRVSFATLPILRLHRVELYDYLINDELERIWKEEVVA